VAVRHPSCGGLLLYRRAPAVSAVGTSFGAVANSAPHSRRNRRRVPHAPCARLGRRPKSAVPRRLRSSFDNKEQASDAGAATVSDLVRYEHPPTDETGARYWANAQARGRRRRRSAGGLCRRSSREPPAGPGRMRSSARRAFRADQVFSRGSPSRNGTQMAAPGQRRRAPCRRSRLASRGARCDSASAAAPAASALAAASVFFGIPREDVFQKQENEDQRWRQR
jgi:hypothetical protein